MPSSFLFKTLSAHSQVILNFQRDYQTFQSSSTLRICVHYFQRHTGHAIQIRNPKPVVKLRAPKTSDWFPRGIPNLSVCANSPLRERDFAFCQKTEFTSNAGSL
ncbi:hypothetical protein AVEN_142327-1 [Araneus ventricosus]|uniref:Uncharacterized protein n=1 Tax=Araneus ventricosus TaxID=182803 RepID=A0A4Y2KVJ7_ARAVE|nr:hypothetical protein AVEN_142327-1 [Araneus ventricosus]